MLSYDSLIGEARERGIPGTKVRGVLREYLQVLVLKALYGLPGGTDLVFTGGTCLRLTENTGRFSEDLDFNTWKTSPVAFSDLVQKTAREVGRHGLVVRTETEHRGRLSGGRLVFPDAERIFGVRSPHTKTGGLVIKIETNRPVWKRDGELKVVAGFGEVVPVPCTPLPAQMSDKIDALDKKNMSRHLYDLIVLLGRKIAPDEKVWKALGLDGDPLDRLLETVRRFKGTDLKVMADALRPFLFDEGQTDLILKAGQVVPDLVRQVRQH